jgi:hypothetical protein
MEFEPIEIDIDDLRLHSEIAYLIDSPLFIEKADELRKKYSLNQPFGSESYKYWFLKVLKKNKASKFLKDIIILRQSFGYGSNYQEIFKRAVLGCDIRDSDYQNTSLINFSELPFYLTHLKNYDFGILITPQSDKKDVDKIFNQYKRMIKAFRTHELTSICQADRRIDGKSGIKEVRKWYWYKKHHPNVKYKQIAITTGITSEEYKKFNYGKIMKESLRIYKEKLTCFKE